MMSTLATWHCSPLSVLSLPLGPDTTKAPRWRGFREDLWLKDGCAGGMDDLCTAVCLTFERRLAA
jgi:hypothetical protein